MALRAMQLVKHVLLEILECCMSKIKKDFIASSDELQILILIPLGYNLYLGG